MLLCEHDFVIISSRDIVYDSYNTDLIMTSNGSSYEVTVGDTILFGNAEVGEVVESDGQKHILKKVNS